MIQTEHHGYHLDPDFNEGGGGHFKGGKGSVVKVD